MISLKEIRLCFSMGPWYKTHAGYHAQVGPKYHCHVRRCAARNAKVRLSEA